MEEMDNTASPIELMRNRIRESVIAVLPPGEQLEDDALFEVIDEQIEREMLPQLPKGIPHVFISSVSGEGLKELKEELWKALHK